MILFPIAITTTMLANTISATSHDYGGSILALRRHNGLAFCQRRAYSSSSPKKSPLYEASSESQHEAKIKSLANQLADAKFKNIVVVVGAGASVSAGIPDFRTPGTGLYDKLEKYNLPFPEAIFDLEYYRSNPKPFVDLCQSIWPGQAMGPKPTQAHMFLNLLQEKKCLRRIYTQNIDGLEALAGVSTDFLVECHGHFRSASCIQCRCSVDSTSCRDAMLKGDVAHCKTCGSLVKPDIVFFGEELPMRFQQLIDLDTQECDLLIVMGTSLLVMPVAGIPSWVPKNCPRLLLNRELVGNFNIKDGSRDIFMKGDCDDSVKTVCELAGWEKELEKLSSRKDVE